MRSNSVPIRIAGRVAAIGLVAAGVLVAAAAPASAAVPGLVRISAVSVSDSVDFKSATASCPAGKVLTGTGYEVNGATGEVVVDDFRPNGGVATAPTSVFVGAYEAEAFAGNWSVTAYAICANPVAGLVRISASSTAASNDFDSVSASCPAGKVLTGTGFELTGATGEAVVDDFRPNGGVATAPTSVFVGAYEAEAFAGNWSTTAYAICADQLAGMERASAVTASASNDFDSVSAPCPAGKVLTGAGYEISGATGEAVVDDFRPNGGVATAPTSVLVGAYEEDAFAGNWTTTGYSICATP